MYAYGYLNSFNLLGSGAVPLDPDAQAFITAASITDPTQQSAVNQLVIDLKGYSLWTKMKAVYPFVGGSASAHKWNLKDPRDLDVAFRLSFFGGWTHSTNGAQPNGTNGYAETYIILKTVLSSFNTNHHFSYYSRTQTPSGDGWVMGIGNTAIGDPLHGIAIRRGGTNALIYDFGNLTSGGRVSGTETDARGLYIGSTINSTTHKLYKNGASVLSSTNNPSITTHSNGMAIGAMKPDGGPFLYQNNECAFATIGDGLTDTESANLYTAVQAFQTTLSRNV